MDGGTGDCEAGPQTGSCVGRNSDSYYEYLLKGYILLDDPQLYDMFITLYYALDVYSKSVASQPTRHL